MFTSPIPKVVFALAVFLPALVAASGAGEGKKSERPAYGFDVKSVGDTDRIEAVFRDRKATLAMSNVIPFAKWPTNLTVEENKLKERGLAFLNDRLKDKRLAITGIEKDKIFRGDLVLHHTGSFTPGAPSTLGWGIVHLNCMLIEQGYTVYQRDAPEWWFDDGPLGALKQGREALYKEAEAYAKKNRTGIWKHEELAKKLQVLSKAAEPKK